MIRWSSSGSTQLGVRPTAAGKYHAGRGPEATHLCGAPPRCTTDAWQHSCPSPTPLANKSPSGWKSPENVRKPSDALVLRRSGGPRTSLLLDPWLTLVIRAPPPEAMTRTKCFSALAALQR